MEKPQPPPPINFITPGLTKLAITSTCLILFFLLAITLTQEMLYRPLSNDLATIQVNDFYLTQPFVSDRSIMLSNPSALPLYLLPSKMTIDPFNNLSNVSFATISNTVSSTTRAYNELIETSELVVVDSTYQYGYMFPLVQPLDQTYFLASTNTGSANWNGYTIPHFSTLTFYPVSILSNYSF